MKDEECKQPIFEGNFVYDPETLEFKGLIASENGPLKLWFKPSVDHLPPFGLYAIGCDIATGGTGDFSSNSVACGVNVSTGEQVMEYAVMGMLSPKFGRAAVALAKWLQKAYLGWEASGMSSPFATEVIEKAEYENIYYREVTGVGNREKTKKPGWWNGSDDDKGRLFEEMCLDMEEGRFIPRSKELIGECGEYEWEKGKIVHRPARRSEEIGKAHGDRCIAAGVVSMLLRDRPAGAFALMEEEQRDPPYGSMAWRLNQPALGEDSSIRRSDPRFGVADLLGRR